MHRIWLIFAQSVTVCLAALFVVRLFNPQFWDFHPTQPAVIIKQASPTESFSNHGKPSSFSQAAKKAMPAVVNIFTTSKVPSNPQFDDPVFRHFFGEDPNDERNDNSLGSGVVVSEQGLILTNNHVVASADEIEVALADGRKFSAKIVGRDPETDLAVVKIDGEKLPAITFSDSEKLNVGDVVLAIGNPFGVGQTVTQGIVSALGRSHLGINTFENFIQTDASINPGNSGGALIDTDGNLVGINSAIYSRSGGSLGIGFAIPASLARQVMEQIIKEGGVTRGWIGIEAQDITPELAESFKLAHTQGSLIAGVLKNSPAEASGLKSGDILLEINGSKVTDSASMLNLISALKPNHEAVLTIGRGERTIKVKVLIGKRPTPTMVNPQ